MMVRLLVVGFMVAVSTVARAQAAVDLITNPGFENPADGRPEGWTAFEQGFSIDNAVRHTGARSVRCENAADGERRGVSWTVVLNQKSPAPLRITGWSRAENVSGTVDPDYSLYVDLEYTDGTPLWGQTAAFATGTHDWQRKQVLIVPAKPLKLAHIHALFRGHRGTVWFDDISAVELKGNGFFDSQAVADPVLPPGVRSGWFARDVAADSPILPLRPREENRALRLRLDSDDVHGGLRTARVSDMSGRDRAITVYFVERFAPDGARWWNDIRQSVDAATGERANLTRIGVGATGSVSLYPFGCVTAKGRGRALAIDPLLGPRIARIGYNASARLLYAAFDVALTRENLHNLTSNGRAGAWASVASFDVDPEWGFRSAASGYYRTFPEKFRRRAKAEGIWMPFTDPSTVENVQDFGIAYHEGDNSVATDDKLGILSFRYTEPMTWWMNMPPAMPRTYEAALAEAKRQATETNEEMRRWGQAVLNSGSYDESGKFNVEFHNAPWSNGALWILNPNPYLPHAPDQWTKGRLSYTPEMADRIYGPTAKGTQDGEYLDSIEGWADVPDYRPESLTHSLTPPTFATDSHKPVIPTWFSVWQLADQMAADLHRRGKLLMANSTPWRIWGFAPLLDVLGTETNWQQNGVWRPDSDAVFNLRRTLCYHKPYLLLQNTDFEKFGTAQVEKYFQRSMFYACFPSMFSLDASNNPYWSNPKWYNRDRPLFKQYIPVIQKLSAAGWEPITYARSSNASVYLERYGTRYLTLLNDSARAQAATVTVDLRAFGRANDSMRVVNAVSGVEMARIGCGNTASFRVELKPDEGRALELVTDH